MGRYGVTVYRMTDITVWEQLAPLLVKIRRNKGMRQGDVAAAMATSQSAVSLIERR